MSKAKQQQPPVDPVEESFDDDLSEDEYSQLSGAEEPDQESFFWGENVPANGEVECELNMGDTVFLASAALSGANKKGETTLFVTVDDKKYTLCTLSSACPQYKLDLEFNLFDGEVVFSAQGNGEVSLVGTKASYGFAGDDEIDSDDEEGAEGGLEAEDEEDSTVGFIERDVKKEKHGQNKAQQGKAAVKKSSDDEDDDEDEDDEEVEEKPAPKAAANKQGNKQQANTPKQGQQGQNNQQKGGQQGQNNQQKGGQQGQNNQQKGGQQNNQQKGGQNNNQQKGGQQNNQQKGSTTPGQNNQKRQQSNTPGGEPSSKKQKN